MDNIDIEVHAILQDLTEQGKRYYVKGGRAFNAYFKSKVKTIDWDLVMDEETTTLFLDKLKALHKIIIDKYELRKETVTQIKIDSKMSDEEAIDVFTPKDEKFNYSHMRLNNIKYMTFGLLVQEIEKHIELVYDDYYGTIRQIDRYETNIAKVERDDLTIDICKNILENLGIQEKIDCEKLLEYSENLKKAKGYLPYFQRKAEKYRDRIKSIVNIKDYSVTDEFKMLIVKACMGSDDEVEIVTTRLLEIDYDCGNHKFVVNIANEEEMRGLLKQKFKSSFPLR